jgi:hypothetical protein
MLWTILISLLLGIGCIYYQEYGKEQQAQDECMDKHPEPWVTEKVWAITSDGCTILKLEKHDCKKWSEKVYVTRCLKGISTTWIEKQGKASIPISNTEEF